jgi:hypothetical protein
MSTNPRVMPQGSKYSPSPSRVWNLMYFVSLISLSLMTEELRFQPLLNFSPIEALHDLYGMRDGEMDLKFESLIKTEIHEIDDILKGIDGVRSETEFQQARHALFRDQILPRQETLKDKAKECLPDNDQHTAKVMVAEIFAGWEAIQVDVHIFAPSREVKHLEYCYYQPYQVQISGALDQPVGPSDRSSQKTDGTSYPGSDLTFNQTGQSFGGVSGEIISKEMTPENSQQNSIRSFGTSGA